MDNEREIGSIGNYYGGLLAKNDSNRYHYENEANATFIAAASRIAPDIRQLLAAFEQVCEALERISESEYDYTTGEHSDEIADKALTAAAPYRKLMGGV